MMKIDGNSKGADVSAFDMTDADSEVAQSLGIVLAGSAMDCIDRAVSTQNAALRLVLEAGYLLLKAKAELTHGTFTKHAEARGLNKDRAAELMRMARLYTTTPPARRARLAGMNKSKLLLLADADKEVIEDILNNPDGVLETLSVRGLRQRIEQLEGEKYNESIRANNAEKKAAELRDKKRLTQFAPFTEEVRAEVMALQREAELPIDGLQTLHKQARKDGISATEIARVRGEMLGAGISQAEWGRANGFTRQQVADVLTGRRLCLRGAAHAVAVALGLKAGRIVTARDFKPAHKHQWVVAEHLYPAARKTAARQPGLPQCTGSPDPLRVTGKADSRSSHTASTPRR